MSTEAARDREIERTAAAAWRSYLRSGACVGLTTREERAAAQRADDAEASLRRSVTRLKATDARGVRS